MPGIELRLVRTCQLANKAAGDSACKVSFQKGFKGFVAFDAKTKLIQHYEKILGAYRFGGQRIIIPTQPAQILIDKYFKS